MEKPRYPKLRELLLSSIGTKSQQYVASCCGVSQQAVSKWFTGENRPHHSRLVPLATALDIDIVKLTEACEYSADKVLWAYEQMKRSGKLLRAKSMSEVESDPRIDLDYARVMLQHAYQVRIEGNPRRSIAMASELNALLMARASRGSLPARREIARLRGLALLEIAKAGEDFFLAQEILPASQRIIDDARQLARLCDDEELFWLAEERIGNLCYIAKKYEASLRYLSSASSNITNVEAQLAARTTMSLDWAYLGFPDRAEREANLAKEILQGDHELATEKLCDSLQTLARSQAITKSSEAFSTLARYRDEYYSLEKKRQKAPMRAVQLASSELEVVRHLTPSDKRAAEGVGMKALRLAKVYGFTRHEQRIRRYLEQSLGG